MTSFIITLLFKNQIGIITNAKVVEITENSVSYEDASGNIQTIPAFIVVNSFGYKAYNPEEIGYETALNI